MSQIIVPMTSGNVPPNIPTSFATQDGTAVPSANVLIVNAFDSTENNSNGIITKGGIVGTGTSNEVDVILTNRVTGTATTTDGITPVNVFTFQLGVTPGAYVFTSKLTVFNLTDSLSAGYSSQASVVTNGIAGTLIDTGNFFTSEEAGMETLDLENSVTGNTLQLNVTGLAGKTIHYVALTDFIFVS